LRKYINSFSKASATDALKTLVCCFSLPLFQRASAASLTGSVVLALKIAGVGLLSLIPFFLLSKLFKIESYTFFNRIYFVWLGKEFSLANSK